MRKIHYSYAREQKQNPYTGFTSFQHFGTDVLYSDLIVKPENNMTETEHVECYPVPSYVEEKGKDQGYYPDCSVVYIRILWKEFEPREGEYNYAFIEDILNKAREKGQTVMFRLMQHSTRDSDDVPDWLKRKIQCPARPEGLRVKDSPSDPAFLKYFGRTVRAFGEKFDNDAALAMMDISLPGAWGEGSSVDLFAPEQIEEFVDVYTDVFKNTLLIGQLNPTWLTDYMLNKRAVGLRADCIGHPRLTFEVLPKSFEEFPDVWKKGHISFESYWWLGEWKRKGWDPDKIMEKLLSWHVSTFNAKSLPVPYEWKEKVDEWTARMGYHFVIDEVETDEAVRAGEKLKIVMSVDNVGVAPAYNALPLKIRLKNREKEETFVTETDIRNWICGKYTETLSVAIPPDMPEGEYRLEVGIGGGEFPEAYFATNAAHDGHYAVLTEVTVKRA